MGDERADATVRIFDENEITLSSSCCLDLFELRSLVEVFVKNLSITVFSRNS